MPTLKPRIPVPKAKRSKPGKYAYIDDLEVGDSFFLPYPETGNNPLGLQVRSNFVQNLRGQLWKRRPKKFETRTGTRALTAGGFQDPTGNPEDEGIRVWRAEDGKSLRPQKSPFSGASGAADDNVFPS